MPDDDAPDVPDPDRVYRNYLESCRRIVEPVPRDRAHELVGEWARVIADSTIRPTKH